MRSWRCYAEVVALPNLWRAWREFERDKRRRPDVALFSVRAESRILQLARQLSEEWYVPGPYRIIRITDPKRRIVAAASVRDRVVHHAIHRVLAPLVNRRLIYHTYACLPGRGSHRALLRFWDLARRYRFVLLLDVARYFYSIDRDRLRFLLHGWFPEPPMTRLLDRVLDSGAGLYRRNDIVEWLGWEGPMPAHCGLPIGNLTSQWWANLYLDALDHEVCRVLRVPAYQRYMDDLALFGDDPASLLDARERIAMWLETERGLRLKDPCAEPVATRSAVHYLGYRVTPDRIDLGPKARDRLARNMAKSVWRADRLRATVASYRAAWMFGWRQGVSRG